MLTSIIKLALITTDFDLITQSAFKMPEDVPISEVCKTIYSPYEHIEFYDKYYGKPLTFKIKNSVTFEDLLQAPKPEPIRISHEKTRDVKSLMNFLGLIAKEIFDEYFLSVLCKGTKQSVY